MGQDQAQVVDGRALRRVRNHESVVDAILDLLTEGEAQPTAHQVSQRSGVSMRSIFRLFDDMDALHRAAITRQTERVAPLLTVLPEEGPRPSRVEALVSNRAGVFEAISPVRRLAVRLAPTSAPIQHELARFSRFLRDQVAAVFAAELEQAGDDTTLLDALDLATSWESWERLRVGQRRSPARAVEVVSLTVSALLARAE